MRRSRRSWSRCASVRSAKSEAARAIAPELEEQGERALNVLVAASESADLIVVGSRGLHGLKALGSVSERVAHQARSSVLVVRPAQM
jgi:nucleotide-binding universal stress UspA family protein